MIKSSLEVPLNLAPRRSSLARPSVLAAVVAEGSNQPSESLGKFLGAGNEGSRRPSVRRVSTFHLGSETIPSRRASFNPAFLTKSNEDEANEFISMPTQSNVVKTSSSNETEAPRQISRTLSTIDPRQVELYLEQQKLDLENIQTTKSSSTRLSSSECSSVSQFLLRERSENMSPAKRRWIMATTSIIRLGKSSNWFQNSSFVQDTKKNIIQEEDQVTLAPITHLPQSIKQKNATRLIANKGIYLFNLY